MQAVDYWHINWIMLLFPSLRANSKQANWSIILASLSDTKATLDGIQSNQSADFHYDYHEWSCFNTVSTQ